MAGTVVVEAAHGTLFSASLTPAILLSVSNPEVSVPSLPGSLAVR
jgi:hypothetical protein